MNDYKLSTHLVLVKRIEECYMVTNEDTQNKDETVQTNAVPYTVTSYPIRQTETRTEPMYNPVFAPSLTMSLLCSLLAVIIGIVSAEKIFDTWTKRGIRVVIGLVFLLLVFFVFVSWKCFQSEVMIKKTIEYSYPNKN